MYIGQGDNFKLTDCDDACGLKHYTLAFIIAKQDGRGKDAKYLKEPSWDGRFPMEENLYLDQITEIRKRGGDVIVSFGGEAGRELAIVEEDPVALEKEYQSILDRYHFTWLDFDIEGSNLEKNPQASERAQRRARRTSEEKSRPDHLVHPPRRSRWNFPSLPALLADAKAKGVRVHSANIMVMYFGKRFTGKGKSEGQLGIESANTAYAQIQKIDPTIQIGLCPCLGRNGSGDEVFGIEDAKQIKAFADETPWVCSLHYWSINDDSARPRRRPSTRPVTEGLTQPTRKPWEFANIFKSFTTK